MGTKFNVYILHRLDLPPTPTTPPWIVVPIVETAPDPLLVQPAPYVQSEQLIQTNWRIEAQPPLRVVEAPVLEDGDVAQDGGHAR